MPMRLLSRIHPSSLKLLGHGFWMSLASGFTGVEAIVRSLIVANFLGASGYAVYALALAFNRPVAELLDANFGASLVRFGAEFQASEDRQSYLAIVKFFFLLTTICASLAVVINTVLILFAKQTFFDESWLTFYLVLLAFGLSLRLFETLLRTVLIMHDKYKTTAALSITKSSFSILAVLIVAAVYDASLEAILVVTLATLFLSPIMYLIVVLTQLREPLRGVSSATLSSLRGRVLEITKFTFGNSLAKTLESSTKSCDILLLGAFGSPLAIAIYDLSKKMGNVFFMMKDPIVVSIFPHAARLISGKRYSELFQTLKGMYVVAAIPICCVVLGIFLFSGRVLRLFSPELSDPGWTPTVVMIRNMIPLVFFWSAPLILSLSLIRAQLAIRAVSTIAGFAVAWALVSAHEDLGVAFGMLLGVIVGEALTVIFCLRRIKSELSDSCANETIACSKA